VKLELFSAGGVRGALHPDFMVSSFVAETACICFSGVAGMRL
jgi:hypothetical protein